MLYQHYNTLQTITFTGVFSRKEWNKGDAALSLSHMEWGGGGSIGRAKQSSIDSFALMIVHKAQTQENSLT